MRGAFVHPYIPNSVPAVKKEMLKEIGVANIEDLFCDIPRRLRVEGTLNLPEAVSSEYELERRVEGMLSKNWTCREHLSFLGGGCYQHYVPAVCDEIGQRGEFLTAYTGDPYEDHGRWQALFEYASMMGELLNMEVVSVPTYDWAQAAATSARMASRITKRSEVLVSGTVSRERLSIISNYCKPELRVTMVGHDPATGQTRLGDLKKAISDETAAVYFENPTYLGFFEQEAPEICSIAREYGALSVVGVDPVSLGVVKPPGDYGANIVCGDLQPLGIHMQYGGGLSGFIASHDDEKYVMEYPTRLTGLTETASPGEYGFGEVAFGRTSFVQREDGKEFVGTSTALWAIVAGVYLALMGPEGMRELGEGIMKRVQYATSQLSLIKGVRAPQFDSLHFKEFVVNFDGAGKTVSEINRALRARGIFGGHDLSREFPHLGQSALYCVTEIHSKHDIDRLTGSLREVVKA